MTPLDHHYARTLGEDFAVPWSGAAAPAPQIVRWNAALADELGLDARDWSADVLAGSVAPTGARPVAQVYAGHQFGGFSPRLGDGRALLLGEAQSSDGALRDIALKGSGRTPFSRGGDGKAVVGPVLREYLIAEAMHALGVPTTRALAATTTGETVLRETGPKPGAVLARVADSHLRVGTFQYFAARRETDYLRKLTDYAIARHYPELAEAENTALALLDAVATRQAKLVAKWMGLGFVHGVMNTDNMTISGETIDYGPCAFLDTYDPAKVFSSIDAQGRYAYGNQPAMAQWNLARLAEALLPLIDDDTDRAIATAVPVIERFMERHETERLAVFAGKLGLVSPVTGDHAVVNGVLQAIERDDFTLFFSGLPDALQKDVPPDDPALAAWWHRAKTGGDDAVRQMSQSNPIVIPRNHLVEQALLAAESGDTEPFEQMLSVVTTPFDPHHADTPFAQPPDTLDVAYQTFCGT